MASRPVLTGVSPLAGSPRPERQQPPAYASTGLWAALVVSVIVASGLVGAASALVVRRVRGDVATLESWLYPPTFVAAGSLGAEPTPDVPAEPARRASELELTFVGDIIFGRYRPTGYDPIPERGINPFSPMAASLASDVLLGNLETPIVSSLPKDSPIGSRFRFGASAEHAKLLAGAGFTAVSLANNHWYDMRLPGVEQTPEILSGLGIVALGGATRDADVFRVQTLHVKGWRVGVLAFTNRTNAPMREQLPRLPYVSAYKAPAVLTPLLREARAHHDLLVGFVHWGDEYADGPSGAQRKAAHALIDAGADLVVGHHPHVLQGVERHGGGLVAYSMGNFLFENTNDPARLTGVLRVVYSDAGCREQVRFHPAYIKRMPIQHPVPATGFMGRKVRARMRMVSKRFSTQWREDGQQGPIDLVLQDEQACQSVDSP